MQATQPLPLRDIHLPDPVSWWPPAPGWWLLAIVAVAMMFLLVRVLRRHQAQRRTRPLRLARAELDRLVQMRHGKDDQALAVELALWLRRVCLAMFPRAEVASISGDEWLAFLDRVAKDTVFGDQPGRVIAEVAYRPASDLDINLLISRCRLWLDAVAQAKPEPAQ